MANRIQQPPTAMLAWVAGLRTLGIGLYMARPWGANESYSSIFNYLGLGLFLAWAIGPYLRLWLAAMQKEVARALSTAHLLAAVLVCVGGVLILYDAAFVHFDAQGGLVLLFIPVYQWLIIALAEGVGRLFGGDEAT